MIIFKLKISSKDVWDNGINLKDNLLKFDLWSIISNS